MNPNLSFNISEDSPITTAKDDVFGRKRIVDAVVNLNRNILVLRLEYTENGETVKHRLLTSFLNS